MLKEKAFEVSLQSLKDSGFWGEKVEISLNETQLTGSKGCTDSKNSLAKPEWHQWQKQSQFLSKAPCLSLGLGHLSSCLQRKQPSFLGVAQVWRRQCQQSLTDTKRKISVVPDQCIGKVCAGEEGSEHSFPSHGLCYCDSQYHAVVVCVAVPARILGREHWWK